MFAVWQNYIPKDGRSTFLTDFGK